jgi:hypothetical protein
MDTVDQTLERVAAPVARLPLEQPIARAVAPAKPEMNKQERVTFTAYVVMGILIVLFLVATGVVWSLGG